jgi:hypothetical protein
MYTLPPAATCDPPKETFTVGTILGTPTASRKPSLTDEDDAELEDLEADEELELLLDEERLEELLLEDEADRDRFRCGLLEIGRTPAE